MKNSKVLNLAKISMMTVIIILCSWITIPLPVPVTLQTYALYTVLLLLGGKMGTFSLLLYILLGAAGLPVFASFSAGFGHLLSPTGGYIWGFLLCALLYLATEKFTKKHRTFKVLVLFAGTLLCYGAGTLWFVYSTGNCSSVWAALTVCVLPYVIPDILKLITALFVAKKLKPIINKNIKE